MEKLSKSKEYKKMLSHDDLRKVACSVLKRSRWGGYGKPNHVGFGCSIVLSEIVTAATDIPDAIGWCYGESYLIECKTSRSDFFADQKKPQRVNGTGTGEHRYYLTPVGLIKKDEIPAGWGLLETDGKMVNMITKCETRVLDAAGHLDEKRILLSAIRRIRTREFLIISKEDMDEALEV